MQRNRLKRMINTVTEMNNGEQFYGDRKVPKEKITKTNLRTHQ